MNTFPIATGPVLSPMPFDSHLKKLIAKTAIENFEVDGRKMYKHASSIGLESVVPSPGTADTSRAGDLANDKCSRGSGNSSVTAGHHRGRRSQVHLIGPYGRGLYIPRRGGIPMLRMVLL